MKPRRHPRHAQLHLPPLDADQALTLVAVLERAISAIWRAHGDPMSERLSRARPLDANDEPDDYVDDGDPNASDDTLF